MTVPCRLFFALLLYTSLTIGLAPHATASWVDGVRAQAESGDPFAQTTLGVCYELGEGVDKNPAQAVSWYRKAAENGWAGGFVRLGKCYASGLGVPLDHAKAVELWLQAIAIKAAPHSAQETHVQEARAALAHALRLGQGVARDTEKALLVAKPAALWGLPEAEYELAMCYLDQDPTHDVNKAREWLSKAASGGFSQAEDTLRELNVSAKAE